MTEFLAENNACGRNLLLIVSMGNSIIAELLRLKDYIPPVFRLDNKADQQKYSDIILDFSYLQQIEAQGMKISSNEELGDLDDEIRDNYLELITRFYSAFESTQQYAMDLQQFLKDLNDGYYIQNTLESIMQDEEGKQLMCESLYIFGVILLIIDYHIPGIVRERLLMSYYRYTSGVKANGDCNIDDVCMLLRSTGFNAQAANATASTTSTSSRLIGIGNAAANQSKNAIVTQYPVSYFARYQFDPIFVDMVIGRLRCDDVYNQLSIYPHPDHRSTALSGQAAMLVVCLYFSPKILNSQLSQMREIVDRFFSDNWVVSIYMGITVNLIDAWDQFKAAKSALSSVVDVNAVKGFCILNSDKLQKTLKQTHEILRDNVLLDDFVLQHVGKIVVLIRECNVLLRWYLVHSSSAMLTIAAPNSTIKVQQIIQLIQNESSYSAKDVFQLLLNCSQLELTVKDILRNLIEHKTERWQHFKHEASIRVSELSETFSGSRPILKIEKNVQLKAWFNEINKEIVKLDFNENAQITGHTLIQLIQALEEVQEFHNLQANMHIKQYLQETRNYLHRMIQIVNIKEEILINLQLISDFSYAWLLIDRDCTHIMQESIKKQPKSVIRLRAVFLKLASTLEVPLLRINQAKSEDLISVSKYYSIELVNYVRKVLQIIPETMFNLLARIIQLQTEVVKEIPERLEKEKLSEYAQFEERYMIAKLTHSISTFTEGILMMKKTLVGVIELDPKRLLVDGTRKELVRHLSNALNVGLIFTSSSSSAVKISIDDLESKLLALSKTMNGYVRSFEYIQDYLNIHGLKMLQEELTRTINYNVEIECNRFLHNKVQDWQSKYQNRAIPIPTFNPVTDDITKSNNFIGRLARAIILCTDPKSTIYLDLKATWYDGRPPHKIVLEGRLFFVKAREAIAPAGLVGLDRLYSHMLTDELKRNLDKIHKNIMNDKMWNDALNELNTELENNSNANNNNSNNNNNNNVNNNHNSYIWSNPLKFYMSYCTRWLKVWPTILDWILNLGQKTILRQQLAFELNRNSKCDSKNLVSTLETFNRALLNELSDSETTSKIHDAECTNLLTEVSEYLMFTGCYDPLEQVFVQTKNTIHIALFLSLFTIAHIGRLEYSSKTQTLVAKSRKDAFDVMPMIFGVSIVLQQFHKYVRNMYITYLCQFVTLIVESNLKTKNDVFTVEAITMLQYVKMFVRLTKMPQKILSDRIPEIILKHLEYFATNATN